MNCRRFEDWLDEYVDETLSPGDRVDAERHLGGCAACREALRRQQQIGRTLSNSFQQATHSLRLRPEVRQRVLRDLADRAAAAPDWRRIAWLFARPVWPWAAAAGLVVAAILLFRQFTGSPNVAVEANRFIDHNALASIHVSYRVPIYRFQKEGTLVRDTLTYQTVVVNGSLWPEHDRNPLPKN